MTALAHRPRSRRRLASALDDVLARAREDAAGGLSAEVAPARRSVRAAEPRLRECAAVLRDGPTPPAAYVGAVQGLLEDGNGPLYVEERDLELALDGLEALLDC